MFEIIYAAPLILKVAYTASAVAAIALAITFVVIATGGDDNG